MPRPSPDGLNALRMIQRCSDLINGGLTWQEVQDLIEDERAWLKGMMGDPMEDDNNEKEE